MINLLIASTRTGKAGLKAEAKKYLLINDKYDKITLDCNRNCHIKLPSDVVTILYCSN